MKSSCNEVPYSQELNFRLQRGYKPGPWGRESGALTMRPPGHFSIAQNAEGCHIYSKCLDTVTPYPAILDSEHAEFTILVHMSKHC